MSRPAYQLLAAIGLIVFGVVLQGFTKNDFIWLIYLFGCTGFIIWIFYDTNKYEL